MAINEEELKQRLKEQMNAVELGEDLILDDGEDYEDQGGLRSFDHLIDAPSNFFHVRHISKLDSPCRIDVFHASLREEGFESQAIQVLGEKPSKGPARDPGLGRRVIAQGAEDVSESIGPAITDQVFFDRCACQKGFEIYLPLVLPAGFLRFEPLRVGRLVIPHAD